MNKDTKNRWTYFNKRHKGLLLDKTSAGKERMRRHRQGKDNLYNDWIIGIHGTSRAAINLDYAIQLTIHELQIRYNHKLARRDIYRMLMVHHHASLQVGAIFTRNSLTEYCNKLKVGDYPIHGMSHNTIRKVMNTLFTNHYINPLGQGLYACTMRLNLVIDLFNKFYRAQHAE